MTAVHGGSIPFVARVFSLSEVHDMYPIMANGLGRRTKDEGLWTYARIEYPHEDPLWLLAQARRESRRGPVPASFPRRLLARLRASTGRTLGSVADEERSVRG